MLMHGTLNAAQQLNTHIKTTSAQVRDRSRVCIGKQAKFRAAKWISVAHAWPPDGDGHFRRDGPCLWWRSVRRAAARACRMRAARRSRAWRRRRWRRWRALRRGGGGRGARAGDDDACVRVPRAAARRRHARAAADAPRCVAHAGVRARAGASSRGSVGCVRARVRGGPGDSLGVLTRRSRCRRRSSRCRRTGTCTG